jgi:hypothetical protein
VEEVDGATEANYSLNTGILHRKFLDWIGFPLVVDVSNYNFKASGIYQNKIIFECRQFEAELPKPTGTEPWYIYQRLVDENDNTYLNVSCYGDASLIQNTTLPIKLSLNWSMSANLIGDRNEEIRSWSNSQSVEIVDARV